MNVVEDPFIERLKIENLVSISVFFDKSPATCDLVGCRLPLVAIHLTDSEKDHRNCHWIDCHRISPTRIAI